MLYGAGLRGPMGWGLACSACCSFSIRWYNSFSITQELGVQSADVKALPGVLPQPSMSPASYQSPWIMEVRRSVAVFQLPTWIPPSINIFEKEEKTYIPRSYFKKLTFYTTVSSYIHAIKHL
jgi:hypothetical protein